VVVSLTKRELVSLASLLNPNMAISEMNNTWEAVEIQRVHFAHLVICLPTFKPILIMKSIAVFATI